MRNLKRALSMAMASVMLMGMSVVGTSAVSVNDFSDVDSINNKEAVAIATGLGIFDGYDDGSFKPERVVTRAEMAVVIAKILHGADVDPTTFVGDSKFTDVPAWAEGYVNLVAALGIIEGYGDGKFGPNDPVTTVQANIMLLKALGYYTAEGDSLPANWADAQLQATSKATALGFFGDEALKMDAGLTREDVAELTFNALFAQRVAYDDVRGLHVKANDRMVVVTNGTEDEMNTLAQNTFGLYAVEGTVVANGMTHESLSEDIKSAAQTRVLFEESEDLTKDGKIDTDETNSYDFEIASGLDMIGHAAKIYYKVEKKAPVVYAMVDQATLVDYVTYNANTTKLAEAANAAGFKKNTILDWSANDYFVNYDLGTTVADLTADNVGTTDTNGDDVNLTTPANKTLMVISNSANKNVDCVIVLDQYLDMVDTIKEKNDEVEIELVDTDNGDKMTVAGTDLTEKDYVIVTDIGKQGDVKVLEATEAVSTNISKLIGKTNAAGGGSVATKITGVIADGDTYTISNVESKVSKNFVEFEKIAKTGDTVMVLDQFGKMIGLVTEPAAPNYAYVAQFGQRHSNSSLTYKDVWTAHIYFADGTNGIYEIDMAKSTLADEKWDHDSNPATADDFSANRLGAGTYTTPAAANDTATNPLVANSGLKGIYNVKVLANGKAAIDYLTTEVTTAVSQNDVTLYKGHSTLVDNASPANTHQFNTNVAQDLNGDSTLDKDDVLYQNDDTVYFFVTGEYKDDSTSTLKVSVKTGVKNVEKFTNDFGATTADPTIATANTIGKGIREGYATIKDDAKDIINTMLVQGIVSESETLYYYDEGNYEVDPVDGGFTLTYYLYDAATGEPRSVTYNNDGKYFATESDAKAWAAVKPDGFYQIGATDINKKYFGTGLNLYNGATGSLNDDFTDYVVNDTANYDEIIDNLFSTSVVAGSIFDDETIIVNLTNADLDTLDDIIDALDPKTTETKGQITLSYAIKKNYDVDVLFVTSYTPDGTQAPGGVVSNFNSNTHFFNPNTIHTNVLTTGKNAYQIESEGIQNALNLLRKNGFSDFSVTGMSPAYNIRCTSMDGVTWNFGLTINKFYSIASATLDMTGSTNSVKDMTVTYSADYAQATSGSVTVTVVIPANSSATKGATVTLTGTGATMPAAQSINAAEALAGKTLTFTVNNFTADVNDLKVTTVDVS